jgi:hypothetical protein
MFAPSYNHVSESSLMLPISVLQVPLRSKHLPYITGLAQNQHRRYYINVSISKTLYKTCGPCFQYAFDVQHCGSAIHCFCISFGTLQAQMPLTAVTSVIDGLKRLYVEKLKPLEVAYRFNDFANPLLVNFIHSLVLLDAIGYSVLKSSHADCVLLSLFTCSCFASTIFQTSSDFDAKPMVMLLGQYSTGKTTFIKHLLKTSYPGLMLYHIQQI